MYLLECKTLKFCLNYVPNFSENNKDDRRGKTNNELDKTLNKLMESPHQNYPDADYTRPGDENISWSQLQLPITR